MPSRTTLNHVTITTADLAASRSVYDDLLAAIELTPVVEYEDPEGDDDDSQTVSAVGYAAGNGAPLLWLVGGLVPTTGAHFAIAVSEASLVDRAHRAAPAHRVLQAPRSWEFDRLGYYGLQVGDHDANVIEIVHNTSWK